MKYQNTLILALYPFLEEFTPNTIIFELFDARLYTYLVPSRSLIKQVPLCIKIIKTHIITIFTGMGGHKLFENSFTTVFEQEFARLSGRSSKTLERTRTRW